MHDAALSCRIGRGEQQIAKLAATTVGAQPVRNNCRGSGFRHTLPLRHRTFDYELLDLSNGKGSAVYEYRLNRPRD